MHFAAWGATDVGRVRSQNEDALLVDEQLGLVIVADGMGGHACGEEASRMTVDVVRDSVIAERKTLDAHAREGVDGNAEPVRKLLRDALTRASRSVHDEALRDPGKQGMGTTCTLLLVSGDTAFVAHVGDSRAYLVRDGSIARITRDHSLLNALVADGRLSLEDARSSAFAPYRNALARAVGVEETVRCDTYVLEVLPGDTFVVVSDGLTRHVACEEIGRAADADSEAPQRLVDLANARGGQDNITVAIARTTSADARDARRREAFDVRLAALRRVALFRDLSKAQLAQVLAIASETTLPAGEEAHRTDGGDSAVYAVIEGRVRVEHDGRVVSLLGEGATFGELSLAAEAPAGARVVTSAESRILRVPGAELEAILDSAPESGARLLDALRG